MAIRVAGIRAQTGGIAGAMVEYELATLAHYQKGHHIMADNTMLAPGRPDRAHTHVNVEFGDSDDKQTGAIARSGAPKTISPRQAVSPVLDSRTSLRVGTLVVGAAFIATMIAIAATISVPWPDFIDGGRNEVERSAQVMIVGLILIAVALVGLVTSVAIETITKLVRTKPTTPEVVAPPLGD